MKNAVQLKEERYRALYDFYEIGGSVHMKSEDLSVYFSGRQELVKGIVVTKSFDNNGCDLKVAVGDIELSINAEKVC